MKEKNVFYVSTLIRDHSLIAYANAPAFLDDPFLIRWGDPEAIKALKDPAYGAKARADVNFPKLAPSYQTAMLNFKKLYDAGVRLALGADTGPPGRFYGYFEHLELEQMVKAGLTPQQALQIATLEGARSLGMEKDFGSLENGKRADMILLDADPLEDILNTRRIGRVWVGGRAVE
jgi:imidazolonepropionase-like amidohydrolase